MQSERSYSRDRALNCYLKTPRGKTRARLASRGGILWGGRMHPSVRRVPTKNGERRGIIMRLRCQRRKERFNANLHPRRQVMTYCANFRPGVARPARGSTAVDPVRRATATKSLFVRLTRHSDIHRRWRENASFTGTWRRCITPLHNPARALIWHLRRRSPIIRRETWDLINVISRDGRLHFSRRRYRFCALMRLIARGRNAHDRTPSMNAKIFR